jgi:hypothetical protein
MEAPWYRSTPPNPTSVAADVRRRIGGRAGRRQAVSTRSGCPKLQSPKLEDASCGMRGAKNTRARLPPSRLLPLAPRNAGRGRERGSSFRRLGFPSPKFLRAGLVPLPFRMSPSPEPWRPRAVIVGPGAAPSLTKFLRDFSEICVHLWTTRPSLIRFRLVFQFAHIARPRPGATTE